MNRFIERLAARLYVWALTHDLMAIPPDDAPNWTPPMEKREVMRLIERELGAIRTSIIEHYRYQDREQRILSERLTRRYDVGMAMNEATNRAIEAKKAAGEPNPDNLSPKQKMALEVQAQTLKERLGKA